MFPTIYVVTSTDLGWDCVVAAFDNREAADTFVKALGDHHVVHSVGLQSRFIEEDYL
jgi:hypothetical protein